MDSMESSQQARVNATCTGRVPQCQDPAFATRSVANAARAARAHTSARRDGSHGGGDQVWWGQFQSVMPARDPSYFGPES